MVDNFMLEINDSRKLSIERNWTLIQRNLLEILQQSVETTFWIQLISNIDRGAKERIKKEHLIAALSSHSYFSYEIKRRWSRDSEWFLVSVYFHHPITTFHSLDLYLMEEDLERLLKITPKKLLPPNENKWQRWYKKNMWLLQNKFKSITNQDNTTLIKNEE